MGEQKGGGPLRDNDPHKAYGWRESNDSTRTLHKLCKGLIIFYPQSRKMSVVLLYHFPLFY